MLRCAGDKVNARRFDARMPENIRQLDDILVCAIKCRREQVAQIVRENFPCVDARADAQLFHFRPNLISRHGLAAFGAKDRAGGGFCRAANLSSLRQSFDGSRIVRILPLSAISVLPFFAASTVMYCTFYFDAFARHGKEIVYDLLKISYLGFHFNSFLL